MRAPVAPSDPTPPAPLRGRGADPANLWRMRDRAPLRQTFPFAVPATPPGAAGVADAPGVDAPGRFADPGAFGGAAAGQRRSSTDFSYTGRRRRLMLPSGR